MLPFSCFHVANKINILGVSLHSNLSFDPHISALLKYCFFIHIYALHHICPPLTNDCANLTLFGLLWNNISHLQ